MYCISSVPTVDIRNIAISLFNGSVPFFSENLINMHIFSKNFFLHFEA